MRTHATLLACAAMSLLVAGCAGKDAEAPPPAAQSAQRETMLETTAVVEHVDQKTREVRLRGADGRTVTVVAGPEVRNLPQLATGDVVRLTYYESVAVRMAEPAETGPATAAAMAARAPEGEKPAAMLGGAIDVVVTMVAYDPATAVATFTTPDGATQSVVVHPAMRAFAAARRPGDRVAVELTRAVAVSIMETTG